VWQVAVKVIGLCVVLLVAAIIFAARNMHSSRAPMQLFHDMDFGPRPNVQGENSALFVDLRAQRDPVVGTVAFNRAGHHTTPSAFFLGADAHRQHGYRLVDGKPEYFAGFPAGLSVNDQLLRRGQMLFNNHCAPCHNFNGDGMGPVHERASALAAADGNPSGTRWTAPKNLLDATLGESQYANGRIFSTIRDGANNMAGMSSTIDAEEAWAIVAYVRALQAAAR
jgi:mono/diheme cytochrome c family protein